MIWTMTQKPNHKQDISRQQLDLEKWRYLKRMLLSFKNCWAKQLDQEEEQPNHLDMVNNKQWKY